MTSDHQSFQAAWVLLHLIPEIIEDTNEVATKIGDPELAQLPRFVLGLGNDLRVRGLPLSEEFVCLSLAVEIEPESRRFAGTLESAGYSLMAF